MTASIPVGPQPAPGAPVGQPVNPVDWFRRCPVGGTTFVKPPAPAAETTTPTNLPARIRRWFEDNCGPDAGDAALRAVYALLALHSERRTYDACGHDHPLNPDHTLPAGLVAVDEVGVVCEDGYEYSACSSCCCDTNGYITEECATGHDGDCWPCLLHRTVADVLGLLYPEAAPSVEPRFGDTVHLHMDDKTVTGVLTDDDGTRRVVVDGLGYLIDVPGWDRRIELAAALPEPTKEA